MPDLSLSVSYMTLFKISCESFHYLVKAFNHACHTDEKRFAIRDLHDKEHLSLDHADSCSKTLQA